MTYSRFERERTFYSSDSKWHFFPSHQKKKKKKKRRRYIRLLLTADKSNNRRPLGFSQAFSLITGSQQPDKDHEGEASHRADSFIVPCNHTNGCLKQLDNMGGCKYEWMNGSCIKTDFTLQTGWVRGQNQLFLLRLRQSAFLLVCKSM